MEHHCLPLAETVKRSVTHHVNPHPLCLWAWEVMVCKVGNTYLSSWLHVSTGGHYNRKRRPRGIGLLSGRRIYPSGDATFLTPSKNFLTDSQACYLSHINSPRHLCLFWDLVPLHFASKLFVPQPPRWSTSARQPTPSSPASSRRTRCHGIRNGTCASCTCGCFCAAWALR